MDRKKEAEGFMARRGRPSGHNQQRETLMEQTETFKAIRLLAGNIYHEIEEHGTGDAAYMLNVLLEIVDLCRAAEGANCSAEGL